MVPRRGQCRKIKRNGRNEDVEMTCRVTDLDGIRNEQFVEITRKKRTCNEKG